jgi:hypothetical protein
MGAQGVEGSVVEGHGYALISVEPSSDSPIQ